MKDPTQTPLFPFLCVCTTPVHRRPRNAEASLLARRQRQIEESDCPSGRKEQEGKEKKNKKDIEEINTKIKVKLWKEQAICLLCSLKT